ncbi:uncharacterized protein LOC101217312 [Cucumis sativus]|uniref:uncharacterized protein LOC101217312 n=1 Tax=Cucumis sativus TaxID=3659 RepID=UPI0005EC193A|nr:uncharacterized protein LOC101217312 [Cucumis sativus]
MEKLCDKRRKRVVRLTRCLTCLLAGGFSQIEISPKLKTLIPPTKKPSPNAKKPSPDVKKAISGRCPFPSPPSHSRLFTLAPPQPSLPDDKTSSILTYSIRVCHLQSVAISSMFKLLPSPPLPIFVGGLDYDVSDEDLKQAFSKFGDVVSVKIPIGKGCEFLQFTNRF